MRKAALYTLIAGFTVLSVLAYYFYTWGIWNYVFSVRGTIRPSPNAHLSDDSFLKAEPPLGSVLLLHGLNFESSKMQEIAHIFLERKYSVLIPRLSGHRGAIEETLTVPTETWFKQFAEWKTALEKPLICAGYSLGGLLVTERYLSGELDCEKFILFAPAFALRTPHFVAELFAAITPSSLTVPSGIPHAYMHFDHPGIGPTFAATQTVDRFHKQLPGRKGKAMPPGLVFIDPRDKVIGPLKVKFLIQQHFPDWKIVDVNALDLDETHAFHLIVDEKHLGADQWRMINEEITRFLNL